MKNVYPIIVLVIVMSNLLFSQQLVVEKLKEKFKKPVYLTAPKNQSDTLFIVEQNGVIQTIINGKKDKPLLNLIKQVHQPKLPGDERGLLGMALHPRFHENGKFYVNYINHDDETIISSFTFSPNNFDVDRATEKIILKNYFKNVPMI